MVTKRLTLTLEGLSLLTITLILVGFGAWLVIKHRVLGQVLNPYTYQAVFLDNNQIYFGRLEHLDSSYPVLTDAYYVRITNQEGNAGKVVPLGDTEPHRPENQMILNKEHILFVENLKADSPVIKVIQGLKSNQ